MIEVIVEDEAWRAVEEVEVVVLNAAEAALSKSSPVGGGGPRRGEEGLDPSAHASGKALSTTFAGPPPPTGEDLGACLTLLLTSDAAVHDLNVRFRGQDKPTNVLSFPAWENPEGRLGDIALAFGVCAREAAEQGKALADHLSHLVIHGVLHLLGHDHEDEGEAEAMEAQERLLLAGLGIGDPYA